MGYNWSAAGRSITKSPVIDDIAAGCHGGCKTCWVAYLGWTTICCRQPSDWNFVGRNITGSAEGGRGGRFAGDQSHGVGSCLGIRMDRIPGGAISPITKIPIIAGCIQRIIGKVNL